MLDIKALKNNFIEVEKNLKLRGYKFPFDFNIVLQNWQTALLEVETLRAELNKFNKQKQLNIKDMQDKKKELLQLEQKLFVLEKQKHAMLLDIPNLLHDTVPKGNNHLDNPVIELFGNPNLALNKNKVAHDEIAQKLQFQPQLGVDLAASRFLMLPPVLAKLHRQLLELALNFYTKIDYQEYYTPFLVNERTITGTGQFPKFKDEVFVTQDNLYLIPTGEVPLTNILADQILNNDFKELKLVARTPCFRREVGSAGKDTKGFLRQHQFEKVELVHLCHPDNGYANFLELFKNIKAFINLLGVPYRVVELCTGDIGFGGHKAYDIEMWFHGEQAYREIATLTWCHDFQARRMQTRLKDKRPIHTLNGTGLAAGRVLAAILEYYWDGKRLQLPDWN